MTVVPRHEPWRWSALLLEAAPLGPLLLFAGAVCAAAAWLLVSPDVILSRQRTPDLLFNLAGAWYLHQGLEAHVDFHDPLGSLYFRLTELGFRVLGPSVSAFLFAELAAASVLFLAATGAVARRLPLAPSVLFVLFTCLTVLVPANAGGVAGAFTFAMAYNSYGWAALGVVSLILFLPPRARTAGWLDLAIAGGLIVALYQLKVTYFLVALAELAVALAVCPHIRARRRAWIAIAAATLLNAVAPWNWPYLADVAATIAEGGAQANLGILLGKLFASGQELALYAAALVIAIGLWRSGNAPLRLPVAIAAVTVAGLAILSQNTQMRDMPACTVIAFLLYDHFRPRVALLLALLVFPLAAIARDGAILVAYNREATRSDRLFVAGTTNLKGLAVRRDRDDLLRLSATASADDRLLNRIRTVDTAGDELSQFEYLQTLLEAAALLQMPRRADGPVVLLDQVNPLPFMLGQRPPRGVSLWLHVSFPWPLPETMFGDARHVLIPKFPADSVAVEAAVERYGDYVDRHFTVRVESPSWILVSRP